MLQVHNTLSRRKEPFEPLETGKVRMYVCGMTVYDLCHLGHARVLVVFDVIYRYLRELGYDVTYVRNITDIDDKIIARAAQNGESIDALTQRFIDAMHEDADDLGVLRPDEEPRATGHIPEMLGMIERLIEKGLAYVAGNGDVCYAVKEFDGYGKLSGKNVDELRIGARVDAAEGKRDALDFVLWKSAKPGEPAWDSPWGQGRPGWHIECSAMSTNCLGDTFDIHGGGMDLQFPHHENEIAQSEGATGHAFVKYWLHNGFVRINEEKMSKSLGNFFTVREVLEQYAAEEIRYFIVASHYRSPLNYSDAQLDSARAGLTRLYTALRGVTPGDGSQADQSYRERFHKAMQDDFNTAEALAVLFDAARELNRLRDAGDDAALSNLAAELLSLAALLGLLKSDPEAYLRGGGNSDDSDEIDALVAARSDARTNKDWAESDRIRDELTKRGIVLEDGADGSTWRRA